MNVRHQPTLTSSAQLTPVLVLIILKLKGVNDFLEVKVVCSGLRPDQNSLRWHSSSPFVKMKNLHFRVEFFFPDSVFPWNFEINMKNVCKATPSIGKISVWWIWFHTFYLCEVGTWTSFIDQSELVAFDAFLYSVVAIHLEISRLRHQKMLDHTRICQCVSTNDTYQRPHFVSLIARGTRLFEVNGTLLIANLTYVTKDVPICEDSFPWAPSTVGELHPHGVGLHRAPIVVVNTNLEIPVDLKELQFTWPILCAIFIVVVEVLVIRVDWKWDGWVRVRSRGWCNCWAF